MKKLLSLLSVAIIFILFLFPVSSEAVSVLAGDVNESGKIEAADARLVLRASVGLEHFSERINKIADADSNLAITAADARIILRMSVSLEELRYIEYSDKTSSFEVHFIDVGQADCSLILCDGESLLIDGGNTGDSTLVISYLSEAGIDSIDYIICTHAHEDHVGGLGDIINEFTINEAVYAPSSGADTDCYNDFVSAVEAQAKTITVPASESEITLGSSTVEFIAPVTEDYSDINNTSIVCKITYGETSFLFTGDAEREAEQDILNSGYDISADVLKVGHHGSENSTTYPFLREIMPDIAVISVGNNNKYGHPTDEALSRLRDADVKVYRTDLHGHIIISSDGRKLSVATQKNENSETNMTTPSKPDSPENPSAPDEIGEYIGNINSKKLHLPTCTYLPKESNRIYFNTLQAAKEAGYTACERCNPQ